MENGASMLSENSKILFDIKRFIDRRGALGVINDRDIPFKIKRVFWITDVPPGEVRGQHAHRDCSQVIICLAGRFTVNLDKSNAYVMVPDGWAVYATANTHIVLHDFTPGAVCLVLASEYYDAGEVIDER